MKEFRLDENRNIICRSEKTRYGFRHLATMLVNGEETETVKVCYYNRTWETFEFETVIIKLLNRVNVPVSIISEFINSLKVRSSKETNSMFKTTAMVAQMGDVLCSTDKEKNDWKKRMLKAGIKGLDIPEDWDSLSEEEKSKRLDAVIKYVREVK